MARILLVDDDAAVRGFLKRGLELDGHAVAVAADGEEGLDRLQAEGGAFDLVLSDIRMPAMDGVALALAAKRAYPAVPILLMTGYAEQRERAKELEGVVLDVLTKPFPLADARAAVARALGRPARAA